MNFASDNIMGASPKILQAIVEANGGWQPSYAGDDYTKRFEAKMAEVFEREVRVFTVATGTAANALALSTLVGPGGILLTHAQSHVSTDEAGAFEFYSGGGKIRGLSGIGSKLDAADLASFLENTTLRGPHNGRFMALSFAQASECGLVYSPSEVGALGEVAKKHGLKMHMDGARFANALVAQNVKPADITWRAGVDVLSFGATKNGCLTGEAVVFFDTALAEDFAFRRMRAGHLLSKGRLLGAQLSAYLEGDHWLDLARHANAMARRLADGLSAAGIRLGWPVEANEVFPILDAATDARLKAAGAIYYPWSGILAETQEPKAGETMVRFVTSFATSAADIDRVVAAAKG